MLKLSAAIGPMTIATTMMAVLFGSNAVYAEDLNFYTHTGGCYYLDGDVEKSLSDPGPSAIRLPDFKYCWQRSAGGTPEPSSSDTLKYNTNASHRLRLEQTYIIDEMAIISSSLNINFKLHQLVMNNLYIAGIDGHRGELHVNAGMLIIWDELSMTGNSFLQIQDRVGASLQAGTLNIAGGELVIEGVGLGWADFTNLTDGGKLSSSGSTVVGVSGGTGHDVHFRTDSATLAGDSVWVSDQDMIINTSLSVRSGSLLSTGNDGIIGDNTDGVAVEVKGTDSQWLIGGDLHIGEGGNDSSLTVSGGAEVLVDGGLFMGTETSGNSLQISSGGVVENQTAFIGANLTSGSAQSVIVEGENSRWTSTDLVMGNSSTAASASLIVRDSGTVEADNLTLVNGSTLTLESNALVNVHDTLLVSGGIINNKLTAAGFGDIYTDNFDFRDGAKVTVDFLIIDSAAPNGVYSTLSAETSGLVNGAELDVVRGSIFVGVDGSDHSFTVNTGGALTSNTAYISANAGANNNIMTVSGTDTQWDNSANIYVGGGSLVAGGSADLIIKKSATVNTDTIKIWNEGSVDVTGGNVRGGRLKAKTVTLIDGGELLATSIAIGGSNAVDGGVEINNKLSLTGAGTHLSPGSLAVGGNDSASGMAGTLEVADNAVIDVEQLKIWGPGIVELSGGTINLGAAGTTNENYGTINLSGGLFNADFTYKNFGTITQTGGTLSVFAGFTNNDTLTVSDGLVDVIGGLTNHGSVEQSGGEIRSAGLLTNNGVYNISGGTTTITGSLDEFINNDTLNLTGGSLVTGSVTNNGSFQFLGGSLFLNNSDLQVDASGLLGDTVALTNDQQLHISGTANVIDGDLSVDSSSLFSAGKIALSAGATATAGTGIVGGNSTALNSMVADGVSLSDAGTRWTSDSLFVGGNETSAVNAAKFSLLSDATATMDTLKIWGLGQFELNGGTLNVGSIDNLGSFNFTSGELKLTADDMLVGTGGLLGRLLTVSTGKTVKVNNNTVTVDGSGSSLNVSGLGQFSADQLIISNGGNVTSTKATIDLLAGVGRTTARSAARVSGNNSQWTITSSLTVGYNNDDKRLDIDDNAQVLSRGGIIGYFNSSVGSIVELTGKSKWVANNAGPGTMTVGDSGHNSRLNIFDGAKVYNDAAYISKAGGTDNRVIVNGAESLWRSSALYVGGDETGAGGSASLSVSGFATAAIDGELKVWGEGSIENHDNGYIEADSLDVVDGGSVHSKEGLIGDDREFDYGLLATTQASIAGEGSSWDIDDGLTVGDSGDNHSLDISDGADVSAALLLVGIESGTDNNHVTVSGDGSSLSLVNGVFLGGDLNANGGAATLDITDNALVDAGRDLYVWNDSSVNLLGTGVDHGSLLADDVTVRGGTINSFRGIIDADAAIGMIAGTLAVANSMTLNDGTWTNSDRVEVGSQNSFNTLAINGNATVTSSNSWIGRYEDADNNSVSVGSGATWTTAGNFYVGGAGSDNSLNIDNGTVTSNQGQIGRETGADGNSVEVNGSRAHWGVTHSLVVGRNGSNNSLKIKSGGTVTAAAAFVSQFAGAEDNRVDINNNARLEVGSIYIGGEIGGRGGRAEVKVANGGTLTVANTARVWDGSMLTVNGQLSANRLELIGGELNGTGNIDADVFNTAGGSVGPGKSPGLLSITGDYTQDEFSTITFELAGTEQGVSYDWLDVSGTANLGGELELLWYDGFEAGLGDSFDVLTAESFTGNFDFLRLAILGEGLTWDLSFLTDEIGTTDVLRLSVVSQVPVPAAAWLFGSALIGLAGTKRKK